VNALPVNLLLDTHILLWWLSKSRRLSRSAEKAICDCEQVYVSAATAWEIGIKAAAGKLEFHGDLQDQLRLNGFSALHVTVAHALKAAQLPLHHRDPFDRMLVAQASLESLTLLTNDERLKAYGIPAIFG
jgi:PIN domain nuclease of toxin-antitoxin system